MAGEGAQESIRMAPAGVVEDQLVKLAALPLMGATDQYQCLMALGLPVACSKAASSPAMLTALPTQAP